jgi:hypothetical protein
MAKKTALIGAALAVLLAACSDPKPAATVDQHEMSAPPSSASISPKLAQQLVDARTATAKYVTNLPLAQRDGYGIITKMMPGMGYHYLNPSIQGFDVTKPAILVYLNTGNTAQLVAVEWVFPEKPSSPPIEGATYGSFPAACHYKDGTYVPTKAEKDCAKKADTGAAFNFWHPDLTTLHIWLWYDNPDGLYHGTNPLVQLA